MLMQTSHSHVLCIIRSHQAQQCPPIQLRNVFNQIKHFCTTTREILRHKHRYLPQAHWSAFRDKVYNRSKYASSFGLTTCSLVSDMVRSYVQNYLKFNFERSTTEYQSNDQRYTDKKVEGDFYGTHWRLCTDINRLFRIPFDMSLFSLIWLLLILFASAVIFNEPILSNI